MVEFNIKSPLTPLFQRGELLYKCLYMLPLQITTYKKQTIIDHRLPPFTKGGNCFIHILEYGFPLTRLLKEANYYCLSTPPFEKGGWGGFIKAQKLLALASLQKSAALFNSLLQRAFKGELTA